MVDRRHENETSLIHSSCRSSLFVLLQRYSIPCVLYACKWFFRSIVPIRFTFKSTEHSVHTQKMVFFQTFHSTFLSDAKNLNDNEFECARDTVYISSIHFAWNTPKLNKPSIQSSRFLLFLFILLTTYWTSHSHRNDKKLRLQRF